MHKNTKLSRLKIRWLNTRGLILLFLGLLFSVFQGQAQTTFTYTGSVQSVTLPAGSYEIEMWGADGGGSQGGTGGYSKGTFAHTGGTLYIVVGGAGGTGGIPSDINGGYNGGGPRPNPGGATRGSGGGATHVSTSTGLLTDATVRSNIVIVAGGGGGGSNAGTGVGGGGGVTGANSNGSNPGQGGTQTAGGAAGAGTGGSPGTAGQGGQSLDMAGAGGGGWYGGGAGGGSVAGNNSNGGGGGSGYIGGSGVTNGITLMHTESGFVPNPDTAGNGTVIITSLIPCTGTPTAGTASATSRNCASEPFTLSVAGATMMGGGIVYQWQSSPQGTGTWTNIPGAVTFSHTITNQTADTDYRFVVTCTNSSSSDTSNVVTVMQPTPIDFLFEDFDSLPTGTTSANNWPDCWSYVDEVTTTGYGYVNNTNALSGSNSYRLYKTNTAANAGQNLILISPETDNLGNGTKQVRFYARAAAASNLNHLEIVRANGNDATATFTVIQALTIGHIDYQEYIVPLPVTTDDYFGFRLAHNGTTTLSTVHLDDVFYEDLDTCMPPTDITITNISQTTADISWTASATSGATQYEYEVRTSGAPGSGTAGLDATGTVTGLTANVTGLSASMEYSVYVRSICGTTPGRWNHIPEIFNTLCGIVTSNFYENFDTTPTGTASANNWPNCWSYVDEVVTTGYGFVNATNAQSGSNSYRLYKTNTAANAGQNLTLISPETDNLGNGAKQIRFSARAGLASNINQLEIVRADGDDATATFTIIQTINVDHLTYEEYIVPLPVTTDDYFGFRLAHHGGTAVSTVHLDDVYYEDLSPCIFPMNIEVTNITGTTATISWDASLATGVTGYEYEIRTSGAPGSGTTGLEVSGSVTGTTENVTGLTGATEYILYVRSVCGTTPGVWTTYPVSFMTSCPIYDDFYEGFDTTSAGSSSNNNTPICWSYVDEVVTTGYGYVNTTNPLTGNNYRLYKTNSTANQGQNLILISPETDNLGNGGKRLRFWARAGAASNINQLEIVRADGNDATATFTVIQTINVDHLTYEEYIVPLPVTTDDYFGFRLAHHGGTAISTVHLDDIYYEEIPAPTITDVYTTDNQCFGDSTGSASVVVENGAEPLTYEWLPTGGNSFIATDLAAGIYTVTVTDALNRSVTDTITILEPDELLSNITYDDISCNANNDGSASVSPSGGTSPYSIVWSTGDTGNSIANLVSGQYTVTITDANNCEIIETFDIVEPDLLVAANDGQTNVSYFGGSDGSATVDVTGGTLPYTYSWSPSGGTSDTASNLTAGTYTVTVTDAGGCTADVVFDITQPIPLEVHLVSKTDVTCFGEDDGEIVVDVTGDYAPFTLSWTPAGGTGYTASNLTGGTYTVTVANSIGETATGTYTITEPAAMLVSVGNIVDATCNGSNNGSAAVSVLGGTAPYSFIWSNGETGMSANALPAGNHFVHVTDANGCLVQENFTIQQPNAMLINTVSLTDVTCNGQADGAITIAVNGGITPYTYSWSNGQTGTSLSNLSGGSYTVTVTDGSGCSEQKTFTVAEPAFVYPPSAVNQGFCSDDNPQLADMVITGSNIQWYDAAAGGNLLPTTTALTNGTTYYASQTVGVCESTSRTAVQVSLYQSTPLTSTTKDVCYNSVIQDVTIDGFNYTQLKWYSNATSTTALAPTTLLTTATYYISSFTNTVCESARQAVQITVAQSVPAPVVTPQQVCGSGNTLDDLTVGTAAGATLIWYASAQAATPLPGTAQALSGTYYVEQVIGTCKSVRVAVPVQVIPVTSPAMTDLTTCSGTTIADFNAQVAPTKYVWYINNTTTTPLAETTLISSGTFYIAEEVSGCISNRAQVDVVVNQRPNSPTGQTVQRVDPGSTVADLQMNQPGVIWFGSEADALAFTKQLPSNTPLVHNKKYYAVLVGGNNCASLPTEVEVIIVLSTNNLDLTYLKYYPNPTDAELNISYVEAITKVEIFNIAGQKVLSKEFDANEVKVDLSGFGAGTYMVRIETETASQFVKVVKK